MIGSMSPGRAIPLLLTQGGSITCSPRGSPAHPGFLQVIAVSFLPVMLLSALLPSICDVL